jgi:hypothetical protein
MPSKRSELVLAPGTYAYSLDRATAKVSVLVGPIQHDLKDHEGAIVYDPGKGRTVGCPLDRAIQAIHIIPANSYAIVTNPYEEDGRLVWPRSKAKTDVDEVQLQYGRVVHVPGPTFIVPWPGQTVTIKPAYQLDSDQYLIVEATGPLKPGDVVYLEKLEDGADNHLPEPSFEPGIGSRFIVTGEKTRHFIPPDNVRVLDEPKPVKRAARIGALEWCKRENSIGIEYERGPAIAFPDVAGKILETGRALNLHECGVHVRTVVASDTDPLGTEQFITRFGQSAEEPAYYWPDTKHEVLADVEPIEIPEHGGVYVRRHGSPTIEIRKGPERLLIDPTRFELVERNDSAFAPAVTVQSGEIVQIGSPGGSHYVVGPTIYLLEYTEQEGERTRQLKRNESVSVTGVTADDVTVTARIVYDQRNDGPVEELFKPTSSRFLVDSMLTRRFREAVASVTSHAADLSKKAIVSAIVDSGETDSIRFGDVTIESLHLASFSFEDQSIARMLSDTKRQRTEAVIKDRQREIALQDVESQKKHDQAFEAERQEIEAAHRQVEAAKEEQQAKLERWRLEQMKALQDLKDEIATCELDREARAAQQKIELRSKGQELDNRALEVHATANVRILDAIQPELVAAIRAAGAQTSFSKVVQHLGPAAMLQGLGLQDAIRKMIGDEAASNMLLTEATPADKQNGAKKQPSAG